MASVTWTWRHIDGVRACPADERLPPTLTYASLRSLRSILGPDVWTAAPNRLMLFLVMPAMVYVTTFCALTYPLITSFSTLFFTNSGDGLQNVWNLWWVNRALIVLHVSPWSTTYLHYPNGVSLVGHTLNPFNGLLSVPLLRLMTLVEAHNAIVVFSFVMAGIAAFWLSYAFGASYWPSILGGCVFTFSQYHFAHTEGHLQLLAVEWLPVFALLWYTLVTKPTYLASGRQRS